jgi:hypothetical protein
VQANDTVVFYVIVGVHKYEDTCNLRFSYGMKAGLQEINRNIASVFFLIINIDIRIIIS